MRHSNVGEPPSQESLYYISGAKSVDSKDHGDLPIVRARLVAARYSVLLWVFCHSAVFCTLYSYVLYLSSGFSSDFSLARITFETNY